MSSTTLLGILGLFAAVIGGVFTPFYIDMRKDRNARRAAAAVDAPASWQGMNTALVRDVRDLKAELERQEHKHDVEIAQMQETHSREMAAQRADMQSQADRMRAGFDAEAAEMKRLYDEKITNLSTQLALCQTKLTECQMTLQNLYGEMWVLQHPRPGTSPGDR